MAQISAHHLLKSNEILSWFLNFIIHIFLIKWSTINASTPNLNSPGNPSLILEAKRVRPG